jgi:mannosyl-glycoprotein endo-beta-N-acetylglucosaminidase
VNYTWHAKAPGQAAAAAGNRARDVYMGIDVFGRGTWGGGGFKSHVALTAAFEAGRARGRP